MSYKINKDFSHIDQHCKTNRCKNCRHYLFDEIINIKNLDPNNIMIDEKPYKNILIYYIDYVASNSVKTFEPYYSETSQQWTYQIADMP